MPQLRDVRIPTAKKGTTAVVRQPYMTPEEKRHARRVTRYEIVQGLAASVRPDPATDTEDAE